MTTDSNLAVVALVVALVALLTTLGQLLQQYFATADGYRRCQASVVGPHLWLSSTIPPPPYDNARWIVESPGASEDLDLLVSGTESESTELVTWLRFLTAIRWNHKKLLSKLKPLTGPIIEKAISAQDGRESRKLTIPVVKFEERSWDFMPPDVVKPYARISVGDLGVIARRLGMEWERFEPSDGILRAQGNGYMLTSTLVRSVGTMVEISEFLGTGKEGGTMPWVSAIIPDEYESKISLIPCAAADKMAFGILPGLGSGFLRRDWNVSNKDDIARTLSWFSRSSDLPKILEREEWKDMDWMPGFSDVLAVVSPMMYRPDLGLMGVPSPDGRELFRGVTWVMYGFVEFRNQLKALVKRLQPKESSPLHWVQQREEYLDHLDEKWTFGVDPIDRNRHLLIKIYNSYRSCTELILGLDSTIPGRFRARGSGGTIFFNVLSHHVRHMMENFQLIQEFMQLPGNLEVISKTPNPDPAIPTIYPTLDCIDEIMGCVRDNGQR